MGFSRPRTNKQGKTRYTGYYRDIRGRQLSAGTYSNVKDANKAWQRAEAKVSERRIGDPKKGRQTFARYVTETWLPNHVIEVSTRETYEYQITKHIMPWFGPMRMVQIMPSDVREWVVHLGNRVDPRTRKKLSRKTIRNLKAILSAVFTSALLEVISIHPCLGVTTPTVGTKPLKVITSQQFDVIHAALPDADSQLLVETEIESGLRWGELTELRVKDLNFNDGTLTVSRAVVEVNPKFHPTGDRFLVKEYPKDKEYRILRLSEQILDKVEVHIEENKLGADDLIFAIREQQIDNLRTRVKVIPDPDSLGFTAPNAAGRQYKHGSLSGYTAGRCRCDNCKAAYAVYRARRRAMGKDSPRNPRRRDTDGHIPRDWFRRRIWTPAREKAKLGFRVSIRDLRHAHASWLLAGGADLQVVKERLGHGSITTTERYLHTLPNADETALDALTRIRHGHHKLDASQVELQAAKAEIEQLRAAIAKQAIALHLTNGEPVQS